MAKDILGKFEYLVRRLNYSQLRLQEFDVEEIKVWAYREMPLVIEELIDKNWNLEDDFTWTELVLSNALLRWYDKKVCVYITSSYLDFKLAQKIFKTKCFDSYRKEFGIDAQVLVLVDPIIFLAVDDLDSIYCGLNFETGYSLIDLSHYKDDDDSLEEQYLMDYSWLEVEGTPDDIWNASQKSQDEQWTTLQKHTAYR
jgi:hypothetical protein